MSATGGPSPQATVPLPGPVVPVAPATSAAAPAAPAVSPVARAVAPVAPAGPSSRSAGGPVASSVTSSKASVDAGVASLRTTLCTELSTMRSAVMPHLQRMDYIRRLMAREAALTGSPAGAYDLGPAYASLPMSSWGDLEGAMDELQGAIQRILTP